MTSRSPADTRVEPCQGAASVSRWACSILANQDGLGAAANIGSTHVGADGSTSGRGVDELPLWGRATADACLPVITIPLAAGGFRSPPYTFGHAIQRRLAFETIGRGYRSRYSATLLCALPYTATVRSVIISRGDLPRIRGGRLEPGGASASTISILMPGSHAPAQNHLLAALPLLERERIYPHLELIPMPLGKVLYESGDVLRHVYFPTDAIISLLYVMADGASAEISVVGNEGLIGVALFMGGETTPSRAVVQSAGFAYRLIGQRLKDEFHRNGEMQILLLRYTQALLTQMAQTAVCNRHHSVDQQLCRWLLLSLDRLPSNQLTMTQELIANMLGVRREGVTEAAGKLQKLGIIRYSRGRITVLDRPRLEQACCECYAVVKAETDRLLPNLYGTAPEMPVPARMS